MIPDKKIYSIDKRTYDQKTVSKRIEALFLNNIGKVLIRSQIVDAAKDPTTVLNANQN